MHSADSAMTHQIPADLREIVAQVVREIVADLVPDADLPLSEAGPTPYPGAPDRQHAEPLDAVIRARTETVRIENDPDLHAFACRLLDLFESPSGREEVRAGRLTFKLAGAGAGAVAGAVERIDHGAVTERKVAAAASSGTRLVLGPRAVLTPLAREKARNLGVPVEKER